MRNLVQFLVRFNYIFIFLILEFFSFFFIIRNHNYQRTGFLNSANVVTGNILNTYNKFSDYLNLGKVNDDLKRENAQLRERLEKFDTECYPNQEFCDTNGIIMYRYIPVKAINFSTRRVNNYITFNKGSKDGIEKDMGVVTNDGVIGIINNTSENFSTAMSILHKDCRVSVKIKRLNYICTLQWPGGSPTEAELSDVSPHVRIQNGDSIVTSGHSAIFPEGIPVGVVTDYSIEKGKSFYKVLVRLSGQHETLQFAYVVHNLYQEEQRELEKEEKKQDD